MAGTTQLVLVLVLGCISSLLVPGAKGDCPLGQFESSPSVCSECPIGTYGNTVNSCAPCAHTVLFSEERGQTSCKVCLPTATQPAGHPLRKNVNSMDATELRRFRRALKRMQQPGWADVAQVPADMSPFEFVASVHGGPCSICSGADTDGGFSNWRACGSFGGWGALDYLQFGEWNRAYVLQFDYWLQQAELNIKQTDDPFSYENEFIYCPPIAQPYWPWSDQPGIPIDFENAVDSLLAGIPDAYSSPMAYVDSSTVLEPNPMFNFTTSCGQTTSRASDLDSALDFGGLSRAPYQIVNLGQNWTEHSDISTVSAGQCSGALEGPHNFIHAATGGFVRDGPGGDTVGGGQMGYAGTSAFDPLFFASHANVDRLLESWYSINDNRARALASFESSEQSPVSELNIPAYAEAPVAVPSSEGGGKWHDFCQIFNRSTIPTLPFRDGGNNKDHIKTWSFELEITPTASIGGPCSDETSTVSLAPDGKPYYTGAYWVETMITTPEIQFRYDTLAAWANSTAACVRPTYELILTVPHSAASYLAFVGVPTGEQPGFHSLSFAAHTSHVRFVGMTALYKTSKAGDTFAYIDITKRVGELGIANVQLSQIIIVQRNIRGEKALFTGPVAIVQPEFTAPARPALVPHPAQGTRQAVLELEGEGARIASPSLVGGNATWLECSAADNALFTSSPLFVDGVDVLSVLSTLGADISSNLASPTHGVDDPTVVSQLELVGGASPTSILFAATPTRRSLWPYPSTVEAPGPGGFILQGDLIVNGVSVLQSLSMLLEGAELPRVAPAESLPGAPAASGNGAVSVAESATSSILMCAGTGNDVELTVGSSGDLSINSTVVVQGVDLLQAIDALFA